MTLSPRIADSEIDANRPLLAATVLQHPLALQLAPSTVDALSAIVLEEGRIDLGTARRVLRLALVAIDLAEIRASMEVAS